MVGGGQGDGQTHRHVEDLGSRCFKLSNAGFKDLTVPRRVNDGGSVPKGVPGDTNPHSLNRRGDLSSVAFGRSTSGLSPGKVVVLIDTVDCVQNQSGVVHSVSKGSWGVM